MEVLHLHRRMRHAMAKVSQMSILDACYDRGTPTVF